MLYVYLMRSIGNPDRRYVGFSTDVEARIADHNTGKSPHTSRSRPWQLVAAIRFEDDDKARAFEQYLKCGSGHAFALGHFW